MGNTKGRLDVKQNPKNKIEVAIQGLENKNLKDAIQECNKCGVSVIGFSINLKIFSKAYITLRILKGNERRIFNILNELKKQCPLSIHLLSEENKNLEAVKIFVDWWNQDKVFQMIRQAVKKKTNFENLNQTLQEVYQMHKMLAKEDIDHDICYEEGKLFYGFRISQIQSYFSYGANRLKDIFEKSLEKSINEFEEEEYHYLWHTRKGMLKKLKDLNQKLKEEFQWQADELEALSAKYRRNPNDEDSDMFVRLAKVRDEYEIH